MTSYEFGITLKPCPLKRASERQARHLGSHLQGRECTHTLAPSRITPDSTSTQWLWSRNCQSSRFNSRHAKRHVARAHGSLNVSRMILSGHDGMPGMSRALKNAKHTRSSTVAETLQVVAAGKGEPCIILRSALSTFPGAERVPGVLAMTPSGSFPLLA
jgi:hypothetical protein